MMNKYSKLMVFLMSLGAAQTACAEGYFAGISTTAGTVEVNDVEFPNGQSFGGSDSGVLGVKVFGGREFANDVYVTAGYQGFDTVTVLFSDDIELWSLHAGVGYFIPSESPFRFFGEVGVTYGDLSLTESFVLNPGPEEVINESGLGLYLEAGFEYRFGDHVRAGLSYEFNNFDFGLTRHVSLNLRYKF